MSFGTVFLRSASYACSTSASYSSSNDQSGGIVGHSADETAHLEDEHADEEGNFERKVLVYLPPG